MEPSCCISYVNELRRDGDGWALLAPFGDFRSRAVVVSQGKVTRVDSIQRLDREAATAMAENFNSTLGRVKRFFVGVPIFLGHPDVPGIGQSYPDATEKGVIQALEVREDGLYAKPVFNASGAELLNGDAKLYFSGRWSTEPAGEHEGLPVFRPRLVKSVGLTSQPHLPTEMLNDSPSQTTSHPEVKLALIIALLQRAGVEIANDATEAQAETALTQLADKAKGIPELANSAETARGTLAQRDQELGTARTELANAKSGRIADLLDHAVETGRITPAEKPDWQRRLETSFANERTSLLALKPKVKTDAQAGDRKEGNAQFANVHERQQEALRLVNEKMKDGATYDDAFAAVQKENPALFKA